MVNRRIATVLMCVGIFSMGMGPATAALMTAPDRIPSDAMVVISVSDTSGLWQAVKQSALYGATKSLLNLPAVQNAPNYQSFLKDLKAAEGRLKMSLDPDTLFTKTLSGVDFALAFRNGSEDPDLLLAFRFRDAKTAATFLKQIEEEAKRGEGEEKKESGPGKSEGTGATPTAAATPAMPKTTHQRIAGQDVLVIPAEGMWATQKENLLLLASSAEMMNKSLKTTVATSIANSAFIKEGLQALGNPARSQIFFFVDYAAIMKAIAQNNPMMKQSMKSMGPFSNIRFVGVADVAPDHILARTYSPNPSSSSKLGELAGQYPPSVIQADRLIPASSMLGVAFNNFDGPKYLDALIDSIGDMFGSMEQSSGTQPSAKDRFKQRVDQWMAQFEATLGFKLKDDFLASLGPEGEVTVENLAFNPLMSQYPNFDLTFGFQIRDRKKLDGVLAKLEDFLTNKLPMMMGASGGPNATPVKFSMRDIQFDTAKGKVLSLPQLPTYAVGWVIVDNKYVVIGTTEKALKDASEAYAGKIPSLRKSPEYAKIKAYLPEKANSEAEVGVKTIVDLVSNVMMMVAPQAVAGDRGTVFMASMDIVKSVNTAYGTAVLDAKGNKVGTLALTLNPPAPAAPAATQPAKPTEGAESKSPGTESKPTESSGAKPGESGTK